MKDLQSIINKKAEKKLNQDISNLLKPLINSELWTSIQYNFNISIGSEKSSLRDFFWPNDGKAKLAIIDKMLPKYIERESKEFMEKVGNLQEQCNEMFEG